MNNPDQRVESGTELSFIWQAMGPFRRCALAVMALVLVDTTLASLGIGMILPIFQALLDPAHKSDMLSLLLPVLKQLSPNERLGWLAGGTIILFAVKASVSIITTVASNDFLQRLRFHWINSIGEYYLYGPQQRMAGRKQGELLNDWFNETLAATRFYQAYLSFFASCALASALVIMGLLVNWKAMLALLGAGGMVVLLVRSRVFGSSARLSKIKLQLNQAVTSSMVENLANARDIKLMLAENLRLEQLSSLGDELKTVFQRAAVLAETPRILGEFLAVLALMAFVVVGVVVVGANPQDMLPMLAFFFIAFYRLVSAGSIAMTSRVKALNDLYSLRKVHSLADQATQRENQGSGVALKELDSDIHFQDVNFAYDAAHTVLSNVTAVIPKGRTTFLLGPSGAGKSTLLDLLMRLSEPTSGIILANGRSSSDYNLSDWRRCFSYVSQDAVLFNGTIRMNLLLACPTATDSEIEEACRLAGANDFIRDLPEGYDTMVGDRGHTMSGGQRKRIAIARALIRRPSVLILDEATTSFEHSLEQEILSGLRTAMPGLTVIHVTHRLQTDSIADWVVTLEGGRVITNGLWQELQPTTLSMFTSSPV